MTHLKKSHLLIGVGLVWITLSRIFQGNQTLELATSENTSFTSSVGDAAASIRGNRTKSAAFIYFFNPIRAAITGFVEIIRSIISGVMGSM